MNIFVINSGSSSIKYQLFEMPSEKVLCSGLVERIGLPASLITHKVHADTGEQTISRTLSLPDHAAGLREVNQLLTDPDFGVLRDPGQIRLVGHRVVHGGETFAATTIITPEVKDEIRKLFPLAPLHNPSNLLGIEVAEQIFPNAVQVAVFDTAFHQTMPEKAFRYAIPPEFYQEWGVRVYGFHGTSHKYVAAQAADYLGNPQAKIITIHLGNGCSMAAVDAGRCLDTSMGLGPLDGLIMGTRSGQIDPSVIFFLISQLGYPPDAVSTLLNKQSGMLGLTGYSDMRDITRRMQEGDSQATLAYEMYAYRIRKYIGAYAAVLNGMDALVFTAGVGENDRLVRAMVCRGLEFLGITLDEARNEVRSGTIREINQPEARVKILVIPTNEELEIARQAHALLHAPE